jgi:hypothetical protein
MQCEPSFPWMRELVVPAIFTIIGAVLGFIASQLRDDLKARRAKESFLRAVAMELDALGTQLDNSLQSVNESVEKISGGAQIGPSFAGIFLSSVFTNQVGKLRDLADPILIETVHFYSDLGILEQIVEKVNDMSREFGGADIFSGAQDRLRPVLLARLNALRKTLSGLIESLGELRAKLTPFKTSSPA